MNPRMQFFVRNPREGHTKIIRNIPVITDKLIYELVIYSGIENFMASRFDGRKSSLLSILMQY
jgi:hypothetical protein